MTPEGYVKNSICAYLQAKQIKFFIHDSVGIFDPVKKIYRSNKSPYRRIGVADIIGWRKGGQFFAIEVKSEKGRATPEQKQFIQDVKEDGGIAFIARSIDDVKREMGI
jgi:hypothetical protein